MKQKSVAQYDKRNTTTARQHGTAPPTRASRGTSTSIPVSLRLPSTASPQDLLISGPGAVVTGTKTTPGYLHRFWASKLLLAGPSSQFHESVFINFISRVSYIKKQDRRLVNEPTQEAIFRCFLHLEERFVQSLPTEGHLGPQPEAFLSPGSCPVIGGY